MWTGKIKKIEIHLHDRVVTFNNGEFPSRYKASFASRRSERISDFWKLPLKRLIVTYIPPNQTTVLTLAPDQMIKNMIIDFHPFTKQSEAILFMNKESEMSAQDGLLQKLVGHEPAAYLNTNPQWNLLALCPDGDVDTSQELNDGPGLMPATSNGLWNHVSLPVALVGPVVCTFTCLDCSIEIHATIEKLD